MDQMLDATSYPAALGTMVWAHSPGLCVICSGRYRAGDRIAELPDGGLSHGWCVAKAGARG